MAGIRRDVTARFVHRHRRALAALAAAGSMAALGLGLQPRAPDVTYVVVAAADLSTGHRLDREDLGLAEVPTGLLPAGAGGEPAGLVGRVLAAPVSRGEPLSPTRLTSTLGAQWPNSLDRSPLPVRFADPGAAALLSAGQRVDVLAASAPGVDEPSTFPSARLVASDVLVLAVIAPEGSDDGSILGGVSRADAPSPLVVLDVDRAEALAVAGAQAQARLSFTMQPPPG